MSSSLQCGVVDLAFSCSQRCAARVQSQHSAKPPAGVASLPSWHSPKPWPPRVYRCIVDGGAASADDDAESVSCRAYSSEPVGQATGSSWLWTSSAGGVSASTGSSGESSVAVLSSSFRIFHGYTSIEKSGRHDSSSAASTRS